MYTISIAVNDADGVNVYDLSDEVEASAIMKDGEVDTTLVAAAIKNAVDAFTRK